MKTAPGEIVKLKALFDEMKAVWNEPEMKDQLTYSGSLFEPNSVALPDPKIIDPPNIKANLDDQPSPKNGEKKEGELPIASEQSTVSRETLQTGKPSESGHT